MVRRQRQRQVRVRVDDDRMRRRAAVDRSGIEPRLQLLAYLGSTGLDERHAQAADRAALVPSHTRTFRIRICGGGSAFAVGDLLGHGGARQKRLAHTPAGPRSALVSSMYASVSRTYRPAINDHARDVAGIVFDTGCSAGLSVT